MECNKDEAMRAKVIAEKRMQNRDFSGAQKFVRKAQQLFPELDNISQMLAVCDVHCSAQNKMGSEMDWYGILQIERSADDMTIKKQYRKFSLLLHPDKNKFSGAEDAFKLIGEAYRLLSDQSRRSLYDIKCRATAIARASAPKPQPYQSQMNSFVKKQHEAAGNSSNVPQSQFGAATAVPRAPYSQFTASPPFQNAQKTAFWTCCNSCGIRYQYYRNFVNRVIRCQNCKQSFTAYDLGTQSMAPGFSWSQIPNQNVPNSGIQNGFTNAGPAKVASQGNGGKPSGINLSDKSLRPHPASNAGNAVQVDGDSKTQKKVDICMHEKGGVGMPKPKVGNGKEGAGMLNRNVEKPDGQRNSSKRKRKLVDESSDSCEFDTGDEEQNLEVQENDTHLAGQKAGPGMVHHLRRSSRQKQDVSYMENADDDFVSPPKRSKGSKSFNSSEEEVKEAVVLGGISKDYKPAGSADGNNRELKQKATTSVEESLTTERSISGDSNVVGKEAEKSRVDDASKLDSDFAVNPGILEYPDADFNDFDKYKAEYCFAVNQVWAIYDTWDGMPRFYACIKKVSSRGFKLQIAWLEPDPDDNSEIDWCDADLPVACGKFVYGTTDETEDRLMFSHQISLIKVGRGSYLVYPKVGETWAIFRDWDSKWSSDPENHKPPYQFDIVEILTDFMENVGVGVAYLGKVKGFVSLFQQTAQDGVVSFHVKSTELYRFSHCIPSVRMTGKEREGVPVGSYELDPASLPTDLYKCDEPGDVKTENKKLEAEANGSCSKSLESKVHSMMDSKNISTKKHESDPERENSILGTSLRGSRSETKNQNLADANRSIKEEDCSKGITCNKQNDDCAMDALKPRRSPRDFSKKSNQVNGSQCTTQENVNKLSDAKKEEKHSFNAQFTKKASSSQSNDKMHLHVMNGNSASVTEISNFSMPLSAGCKIAESLDFKAEKSEEKFQVGQEEDCSKGITPNKQNDDCAMDALKPRRSPRDFSKKSNQANGSQFTTQENVNKLSDSKKEHSFNAQFMGKASSSQSDDKMHLHVMNGNSASVTEISNASTPLSAGCKIAESLDFKAEKSDEKFQVDQVWALYNDRDKMPKSYAQVKKIESRPDFRLHVALLEPCLPPKDPFQPVCCGMFKVKSGKAIVLPRSAFSHRVQAGSVGRNKFEICPRKGEVWAVYKNWNRESMDSAQDKGEFDIVEILEEHDQSTKVAVLTRLNGSQSLYRAPRSQRMKTGFMEVPRADFGRFSHRIPAIQLTEGKSNQPRGYWNLDPLAIPGIIICLD